VRIAKKKKNEKEEGQRKVSGAPTISLEILRWVEKKVE
jgi:hypothetical protein